MSSLINDAYNSILGHANQGYGVGYPTPNDVYVAAQGLGIARTGTTMPPPLPNATRKLEERLAHLKIQLPVTFVHAFETETHSGVFLLHRSGEPLTVIDENPAMFPSDAFVTALRLLK